AQKLIDSTLEKVLPPPKDSVTVFQHFDKSHSEPCLVPQCAPDQNLSAVRQKLEVVFLESDANGDGFMTLQEFEFFLSKLNIKMSHQDLIAFLKADKEGKCEVGGITQFINKRWEKFDNLKRDGKTGKLVMVGGVEAKNVLPGEYSLVDLITWS
ncbi:unnamed protein product, partial [Didymodactylos carnosus]